MKDHGDTIELTIDVAPGVWVHCAVAGPSNAPALVLLPPLGGSGELFDPFRTNLAADHSVITCEPPGSGDSAAPRGIPSTRALARDVVDALHELGVERAHLFGISLGSFVAQWVAIDAPALVDHLVLASSASRGLAGAMPLTLQKLAIARGLVLPESPAKLTEALFAPHVLDDAAERKRIQAALEAHPHALAEVLWLAAAAAAHDARDQLARIGAPTLVLGGEDDEILPKDLQDELAAAIPGAVRLVIPGAGHAVAVDQPQRAARSVRHFLRNHPL
ncbi:MAG: alpha/beta fold hydrolase [Polyangiaceae bacterium]|nr:alpha/beta fold hydrolase [Polyangiaceae bacterium]